MVLNFYLQKEQHRFDPSMISNKWVYGLLTSSNHVALSQSPFMHIQRAYLFLPWILTSNITITYPHQYQIDCEYRQQQMRFKKTNNITKSNLSTQNTLYQKERVRKYKHSPKVKPSVLIRALLQITIDTDETTDKLKAPTVPSWNFWPSLIFTSISNHAISLIQIYQNPEIST